MNYWRLLRFFISLDDLHDFWLPKEKYRKIFKAEYLNFGMLTEDITLDSIYYKKIPGKMSITTNISARTLLAFWNGKYYPVTKEENIKILDDYLTLCEKNNVQPILFLTPMYSGYKKYFNKKIMNEFYYLVSKALEKHPSTRFFNGWKLEGFTYEYFFDYDHLNAGGAEKFSTLFNDFIMQLEANKN